MSLYPNAYHPSQLVAMGIAGDHRDKFVAGSCIPRLTSAHLRLWGPAFHARRARNTRELTWYRTGDLQQMLSYLDVLAAQRGALVPVTHPDVTVSLVKGLGDPQAAPIWLLQALTGRRASEILMLEHNPLHAIPGAERPSDSDDPDTFVVKLRYRPTPPQSSTSSKTCGSSNGAPTQRTAAPNNYTPPPRAAAYAPNSWRSCARNHW